jgi:predicted nucleotidyltransferase
MKYIPSKFKTLFNVAFLERTWKYGEVEVFRAERLYTAQNYQAFLETFRKNFSSYVYFDPFRGKEVITAPLRSIRKVFVPKDCLSELAKLKTKDRLQELTLDFVALLSSESGIAEEDFGVHGSVALGMHSLKSDIDIVVYGSENFRILEKTVEKLVKTGTLSIQCKNRLDAARRFKGYYRDRIFMYNAVRKPAEVTTKYGTHSFKPLKKLEFQCQIRDDSEAMFRPAIYRIENYKPIDASSTLSNDEVPQLVVSMIGCYRNIAKKGGRIRVSGMLELVTNLETEETFHQVVVGTGINEEEYVWPL